MESNIRKPAVAGAFYESNPEELSETIDSLFLGPLGPGRLPQAAPFVSRNIVGLVVPHAGYQYSGYAAAWGYYALAEDGLPDTAIILGPNHHGRGAAAAIMSEGAWATPFGNIEIDSELAGKIISSSAYLSEDASAHALEHSLEVQAPFLQYIGEGKIRIVPITISALSKADSEELVQDLGNAISTAISETNTVIIASSDLNHYQTQSITISKDQMAILEIEQMEAFGLLNTVSEQGITMCGVVPTAIAISAAKKLGAERAELLSHYTSGDILGDPTQVVGYAALKMVREKAVESDEQ